MGTMDWASGDTITAARLQDMIPILVVKTSATSRANTVTNTSDPDLTVTLRPGVTYMVEFAAMIIGDPAGDFTGAWVTTGTVTEFGAVRAIRSMGSAGADPRAAGSVRTDGGTGSNTLATSLTSGVHASARTWVTEQFVVQAGASGGTLTFQWAQAVLNAIATQVTKGYILATPVNLQ